MRLVQVEEGASLRGVVSFGGVEQRANFVSHDGGDTEIQGVAAAGHPDVPDRMVDAFAPFLDDEDARITIGVASEEPFDEPGVKLSLLRAAYLLALDRLGWVYALSPDLQPLRQQVLAPDEVIIEPPVIWNPALDRRDLSVVVVMSPNELRSVAVTVAQHHVFLPPLGSHPTFFDTIPATLRTAFDGERSHEYVGKDVSADEYLLDKPI